MKKCTKCGEEKELSEFHKNVTKKYGLSSECKVCVLKRRKKYREKNIEKIKEYRKKNKEKKKEYNNKYYEKNKEKIIKYQAKYKKNRRKTDPQFKLRRNIVNLIRTSVRKKGYTKKSRTHEILGCSYPFFKRYLEGQFKKGMTWDNYGEWHLDHVKPVSSATTEEEIIALNHYTNFQPMWGKENISKGNTIPVGHQLRVI